MRVAALYDIHGNLPALDAVLDEIRREKIDRIVIGGDVVPGPMPRETLDPCPPCPGSRYLKTTGQSRLPWPYCSPLL